MIPLRLHGQGVGDIGMHSVRIAKGLGTHVLAFDIAPREDEAERIGFEYCSLKDLLARADIVTLHVPANEQTHHLIGRTQFDAMRDGAGFEIE